MSGPRRWLGKLCPHAERGVLARLWRERRYRKLLNYLLVEYQLARGHRWMLGRPYWLTVDPTNFCQLQCPFCPTGAGRGVRDKAVLRLEHFEKLLEELGPCAIHLDLMNWGEPVLNKDLPAMIRLAKAYGIEVKVDANLNDLPQGMAEALVRSGLDILSVSIDGASQNAYETYRIGGHIEKALDNARQVREARRRAGSPTPRLIWQFLVFRHNEKEREEARHKALEAGFDQVSFVPPFLPTEARVLSAWLPEDRDFQLYPAPPGREAAPAREAVPARAPEPMRSYRVRRFRRGQLWSPAALLPGGFAAWSRGWRAWREKEAAPPRSPFASERKPLCKWPWAGVAINPDGSASPCCSVEDQADDFGNAFERGFAGVWNDAMYRRSRRHVRRYSAGIEGVRPDSDHVCERCTAIGYANFRFPERADG